MVETLGDFLVRAYNANERKNYYEVKKNLNLAIKMLKTVGIDLNDRKSDVIDSMQSYT